jgi:hypothetical protein
MMKKIAAALFVFLIASAAWAQDRVCFTRPDGGVSVMTPAAEVSLAQIMAEDVPVGATAVRLCDSAALPPDREFRNAWTDDGTSVTVGLAKARDIQKERIERARLRKARELLEREMMGENVTSEKAALRAIDAKALVDAAATVAALKAAWPAMLPK